MPNTKSEDAIWESDFGKCRKALFIRAAMGLTIGMIWRKINSMEGYTQSEKKSGYGWLLAAAVATALLCFAAQVEIPSLMFTPDAPEVDAAFAQLATFLVRALLVIPLLCVAPALWARSAWRVHPVMLAVLTVEVFALGLWRTGDALQALYLAALIAPIGIALYAMQRAGLSNFRVTLYGSIVTLIALFVWLCVPTMVSDGDAFLPVRNLVGAYRTIWEHESSNALTQELMALAGTPADSFTEILSELKLNAEEYTVELLYYPAALAGLANCLLSHLFNRRGGARLSPLPRFENWSIESAYFYGTMALTLVAYILSFSGVSYGMALVRIGYAIWTLPMSLAGLCTLKRWTVGKSWLFAILCVAVATLYPMVGSLLTVVGMIGFLQERMRRRTQGGGQP